MLAVWRGKTDQGAPFKGVRHVEAFRFVSCGEGSERSLELRDGRRTFCIKEGEVFS